MTTGYNKQYNQCRAQWQFESVCPAPSFVTVDSDVARIPPLVILQTVVANCKKHPSIMKQEHEHEKILFRFQSDIFDKEMVETIWAFVIDKEKGLYKIDNIPFYAPLISSDDLIYAELDDLEQMLTYRETREYSGNSVIQIVIMDDKTDVNKIRDSFLNIGCQSEKVSEKYFSMEIPFNLNYKPIKTELDKLEANDMIGYAEPCLSEKHRNDLI